MAFEIGQKVWAKPSANHGYHHATIVMEVDNGEAFLLRRRKRNWNDSVIHARNLRPFIASEDLAVTVRGVRCHDADMSGGVPH
eukprot:13473036-Ditylum_brightwellii.AAC.1